MAFFDDAQLAALSITRMAFHLVGPDETDLVLLQALDPGDFETFFLEHIKSSNSGRPYEFSDASATRERLRRIADDPEVFQSESELLARDFQRGHSGKNASVGAFLVIELDCQGAKVFAMLKSDDETVLSYDFEEDETGRKTVSLASIERTFVQNREALQKSALIRLSDKGGELIVLDRRNQQKVARYFENFLDVIRVHEDAALTEVLVKVTRTLIRKNRGLVSEEVYRTATKRTYDAAAAGGAIDADGQKSFLETVVGQKLPDDHPLVAKFRNALRSARIDGAPVTLNPEKVRPPSVSRLVTTNDIQIRIPAGAEKIVQEKDDLIIIRDKVAYRYDDTDSSR
jgi:hypothetical protein